MHWQDHPRLRGKDLYVWDISPVFLGSPPLARERLQPERRIQNEGRITPACAGKTSPRFLLIISFKDHPRLRGKDVLLRPRCGLFLGSPPLARERRFGHFVRIGADRITPACAGKTCSAAPVQKSGGDHPRLRGKDRIVLSLSQHLLGSPPLARERLLCFSH